MHNECKNGMGKIMNSPKGVKSGVRERVSIYCPHVALVTIHVNFTRKPVICDHFKMLFSSVKSDTNKDIRDVINKMERGKACALDGIFAEHLLYAGDQLPVLLTLLFNMCILHGYLPPQMISTVLIPIIKNKSGDVTDKGNYRPISLVLRLNMLERINVYIY